MDVELMRWPPRRSCVGSARLDDGTLVPVIITDQQWNDAFGVWHADCDDERAKRAAWAAATEPDGRRVMIDEYVKVTADHLRAANSGG